MDLVTVKPETSISDASELMAARRIRRLLVVDRAGRLAGIVTAHDVARGFPAHVNPLSPVALDRGRERPVFAVMARDLVTTTPETPIEEAARLLRERRVGALPVVRKSEPVGIITESDVFEAFMEVVGAREAGVRVTFDASEDEDVVRSAIDAGRRHGLRVASVTTMHHEGKRLCVVRLAGFETDSFVEEVWRSGHVVLGVLRTRAEPEAARPSGS